MPNFEIHGEFGFISDFEKKIIDVEGMVIHKKFDAKSYMIGLRYLTELNTTIIAEYYHDGTGLNEEEMEIFFSTINRGYELFLNTGDNSLFKQAENLGGTYERMNSMKDYLYLRMNQKEPFNILYFTPAITWMLNIQDRSFSLSPEILYIPVTNLELRGKFTLLTGPDNTEYGERQNDYRMELRIRYYF